MPFLASMKYTEKMASPSSKTASQQNYKLRNLLFKNISKSMPCREIRCVPAIESYEAHISPIEWSNVILYGEYKLNRDLVK